MASLKDVIAALRREIDDALAEGTEPKKGIELKARRILLSLGISISERPTEEGAVKLSFEVLETGAAAKNVSPHTLTFHFEPRAASAASASARPRFTRQPRENEPKKKVPLNRAESEWLSEALAGLFGAPGFDSSARATVFREAFAELSEIKAGALADSFSGGTTPEKDVSLRNARHRISGVLRSGPARSTERGAEILAEIFGRHALETVLRLIQEKWKSQQDWLDRPSPSSPPKP